MPITIDSLELKIQHNADDAISALDKLIETLGKLKSAAAMGGELSTVARGIHAIEQAASNNPKKGLEKGLKAVAEAAKDAKNSIEEVANVAEQAMGSVPFHDYGAGQRGEGVWEDREVEWDPHIADRSVQQAEAFQNAYNSAMEDTYANTKRVTEDMRQAMYDAGAAAADAAQQVNEAAQEMDISEEMGNATQSMSEMSAPMENVRQGSNELTESLEDLDEELDLKEEDIDDVEEELEDFEDELEDCNDTIEEHTSHVRSMGNSYKSAKTGLDKFLSTVKRLVVMRAIRAAIREVAKGFSEGLEDLYRYSDGMKSMDSSSAKNSLDAVAASLLYLKNSVGAAVAPLIQSLVPVLQTVVSWAVEAANAINMFISVLQGKTTFTKAKETATKFFEDVKTGAKGASKAAKEARATLLAFDEINRLDADKNSSGSGGGGSSKTIPNYGDMFEEAAIEVPEWMQWILDNMDEIVGMVKDVGLGLAAWVVTNETISGISKVLSMLQSMTGFQRILAGGILLAIGVKWAYEGGKAIGEGTAGVIDYIKTGVGVIAAGVGGALIGSAVPGLGTAAGFVIGITIGLVATLVGIRAGQIEKIKKDWLLDFNSSLKGQEYAFIKTQTGTMLAASTDLLIDVESITGRIDAKTDAKLKRAADLIEEIFGLDAQQNKTAAQLALLEAKVKEFNELDLEGIKIEYDEVTKKITTSREAVEKLLVEMRKQYQLEAYQSALKKSYEALSEAQYQAALAEENLKAAEEARADFEKTFLVPAQKEFYKAAGEYTEACKEMEEAEAKYWPWQKEYQEASKKRQQAWENYATAQDNLTGASQAYEEQLADMNNTVDEAKQALDNYQKSASGAADKVSYFEKILDSAIIENSSYVESAGDVNDTYKAIQSAAQKAAGAIGGVNNLKMTDVHKQLQIVKGDLEALAKKYTVKFEYPKGVTGATGYYGQGTFRAAGGFPSQGELFVSGEAGPELVGQINGRNAVVSGNEISGISNAVYVTGEREVAAINNLIRALNQKDMTAVVTADSIVSGLARKNRRDGVSTVPVSV